VQFSFLSHFSCPILFAFPDGSCKTQIIQSSSITAVIGTDVEFRCQYNIPDKNFESVYWYLQRADQRLTYICHASQGTTELEHYQLFVNRTLSSSTLTIKCVQPRDKAIYYCAVR
ncbi:TRDC protein, partial [Crocuta crocuta]